MAISKNELQYFIDVWTSQARICVDQADDDVDALYGLGSASVALIMKILKVLHPKMPREHRKTIIVSTLDQFIERREFDHEEIQA